MTGKYPFPDDIRDPNRKESNPFADPDTDQSQSVEPTAYAVSQHSNEYQPVYQAILPDRAVMTMIAGVLGLIGSFGGWLSYWDWQVYGALAPMPILSLAGSLPALLISTADLRAMKRGAMRLDRRRWSALSCLLGTLGLVSSLLFFVGAALKYWGYL